MFTPFYKKNNVTTPQKVALIACGSFNPVTNMHLRMFELGRDALHRTGRFHVVGGIISPVSDGYQKKDLAPAKHRCNMIRLALRSSDWIRLDTWESEQSCWLETEKVLAHHRDLLTSQHNANIRPPTPRRRKKTNSSSEDTVDNACPRITGGEDQAPAVRLLCGADLLESFATPGLWAEQDVETLIGRHGLVCITRAGSNPQKVIYESDILSKYQENIVIVTEWMVNEISATKIRRALRRGESVKYLLADTVIDYIREHELYGVPDNKHINHLMPSPNTESQSPDTEEDCGSSSSADVNARCRSSAGSRSSHSMEDSLSATSRERSPARLSPAEKTVACMTDISFLVRRVKNVRVVYTPETCV
ncbi:nicotinamide/nicotinic acid mononucleotide adenylyltransferase 3-like [Babylonia areolata]|uniref:nicotinamide/nicotinic acid mononucleotide adenylyltransferase 3-like n=1 Tax=Babylonia areolata TaxID=304850 RepID=UPI003FD13E43